MPAKLLGKSVSRARARKRELLQKPLEKKNPLGTQNRLGVKLHAPQSKLRVLQSHRDSLAVRAEQP